MNKALVLVGLVVFLNLGCEQKRTLASFSDEELEKVSFKIGTALTQNKPEILSALIGLSHLKDSCVRLAKTKGYSDYQLESIGLENPKVLNDGLRTTLNWLCYYSSIDGRVTLTSKELQKDSYRLTFVYTHPFSIFEVLEFKLITNGYQLFIGDIDLVHRNMPLSKMAFQSITSPGYFELLSELAKNLEKAYNEASMNRWERAEYFYNRVPEEFLFEPLLADYSIASTSLIDPDMTLKVFNELIVSCDNEKSKLYWRLRKEIYFHENDSLEILAHQLENLIGKNSITKIISEKLYGN
ncbi:hypothetical protein [Roseivirga thermotolerans]|uniref:Lipoprotein n=1 Tax=Roseivirga thermotolerans TaxID=1758176 RepID=A0ABQ3I3R7_9BACT|nr:hypothetical protein [Roseivirga thermotolerans]GHE51827.1 hypothetical protein GCM10011340_02540 [Roseivirga thermotolerans]